MTDREVERLRAENERLRKALRESIEWIVAEGADQEPDSGRTPVEQLRVGDRVRPVEHGPIGTVTDANRNGWTIVQYVHRVMFGSSETVLPYQHGKEHLIVV